MRRFIFLLLALFPVTNGAAAATDVGDWRRLAAAVAAERGVDPRLFLALVQTESAFRPAARSRAGAIGLTQLMPATARALGVNPYDPRQNLHGGARHLRSLLDRYRGDRRLALAAYNAGPLAVDCYRGGRAARVGGKVINPRRLRQDLPPYAETRAYVARIERLAGAPSPAPLKEVRRPQPPPVFQAAGARRAPSKSFYQYRDAL
jgi:soluble lytic murein transglycosylase-like protein